MRKLGLVFSILYLLTAGCKLDPPIYPEKSLVDKSTFQPSEVGTTWTYLLDYISHTSEEVISTTGTTKVIAGNTYDVYSSRTNNQPNSDLYFLNKNGLYSMRKELEGINGYIEFYYLKESAAVGESWSYPSNETGLQDGIKAHTVTKLLEKNVEITVAGKLYKGAYHTQAVLAFELGGESIPVITIDFYIVKDVGIVQFNTNAFGFDSYALLKSYKSGT